MAPRDKRRFADGALGTDLLPTVRIVDRFETDCLRRGLPPVACHSMSFATAGAAWRPVITVRSIKWKASAPVLLTIVHWKRNVGAAATKHRIGTACGCWNHPIALCVVSRELWRSGAGRPAHP